MKTRVQKWGNSLAVRIPRSFAEEAGLVEESAVDMSLSDGTLVIRPIVDPGFSLDQLLAGVTEENLLGEIDSGAPAGNEAW